MLIVLIASLFALMLVAHILLWAWFLRIGLRWARGPAVSYGRAVLISAAAVVLTLAPSIVFEALRQTGWAPMLLLSGIDILAVVIVQCFAIKWFNGLALMQAVQAWLPTLAAPAIMVVLALFLVRPFVMEAFVVPSNSMAPTLLGPHATGKCPICGEPAFCSPTLPYDKEQPFMICSKFHVSKAEGLEKGLRRGDRFMAVKFLEPKRWDIIVFRKPDDPDIKFVMRLVGLPGEEITIRDGAVWANGARLDVPEAIQGIEYLAKMQGTFRGLWGAPNRPARLGADEYFVLGDFSRLSNDSRIWEGGDKGHQPFAVPRSHLDGVATHTYWPPSRWRALR